MAKYTDEQIKKALKLCVNWEAEYCEKCPFDDECENAGDTPLRNALDLINRLQAEIERLQDTNNELCNALKENAQRALEVTLEEIDKAKSEAIKEFWDEVKKQSFNGVDCATNADVVFVSDGEDVLAEMVGEGE